MLARITSILLVTFVFTTNAYSQLTTADIYKNAKDSVLLLVAYDSMGIPSSLGSGFYIEKKQNRYKFSCGRSGFKNCI